MQSINVDCLYPFHAKHKYIYARIEINQGIKLIIYYDNIIITLSNNPKIKSHYTYLHPKEMQTNPLNRQQIIHLLPVP